MRIGNAYSYHPSLGVTARDLIRGEWHSNMRPGALIVAGRHLLKGWTVMDRLSEIRVPTLVMAGHHGLHLPRLKPVRGH
jgi:proline iminopeptidase